MLTHVAEHWQRPYEFYSRCVHWNKNHAVLFVSAERRDSIRESVLRVETIVIVVRSLEQGRLEW